MNLEGQFKKLRKNAAYFFAQYPRDYAASAGLANALRQIAPDLPLILIRAAEPNSSSYRWDIFLKSFDQVHEVSCATYARWEHGINVRSIVSNLIEGFPNAYRVKRELEKIEFLPNSVAFVFDGYSLNDSLFLKRLRKEPSVQSILITEVPDDEALLSDYFFGHEHSFLINLYQRFFGTTYQDIYLMRTTNNERTRQREHRFRTKAADFVFYAQQPTRRLLSPGQMYWPFYFPNQIERKGDTVLIVGGIYQCVTLVALDSFYQRYNELLALIKEHHKGAKLIYLCHPSSLEERERELNRLQLDGFEILHSRSAEQLVLENPEISAAYSVFSNAIFSLSALGVPSYFLYELFDRESIPDILKRRLQRRWASSIYPKMQIKSVDEWKNGVNDYSIYNVQNQVFEAVLSMFQSIGLLQGEIPEHSDAFKVIPEERWMWVNKPESVSDHPARILGVPSWNRIGHWCVKHFKRAALRIKELFTKQSNNVLIDKS
jgi:hypothetical protein